MRFDWYQATITDDPSSGLRELAKLGHEVKPDDVFGRRWRGAQGFSVIHRDKGVVAQLAMGGTTYGSDKFHALATSENTDDFVSLVRDCWPDRHKVARADSAEDFFGEGSTKKMLPVMKRIAKRHRLKYTRQQDMIDKTAGLTQYMGAPSSDSRVRGYEKGWEQVGKLDAMFPGQLPKEGLKIVNTQTGELIDPAHWFRLEYQLRPRTDEGKELLARLSPVEVWGCTTWTRELALEAMALDLEAFVMRTRKYSAFDERVAWMCRQYVHVFDQLVKELGEVEAMRHILKVIAQQKANKVIP